MHSKETHICQGKVGRHLLEHGSHIVGCRAQSHKAAQTRVWGQACRQQELVLGTTEQLPWDEQQQAQPTGL